MRENYSWSKNDEAHYSYDVKFSTHIFEI